MPGRARPVLRRGPRQWLLALAICSSLALAIVAFFVSVYPLRGHWEPRGYDTPRYLWRTNCVAAGGLQELRHCAPARREALPSRIGYPLVALLSLAVLPMSTFSFAAALPAAAAAAIGLGAAALVSSTLRLRSGHFAAVAIVVATSPLVVAMATPEAYVDTMLAVILGLGALVTLWRAATESGPVVPIVILSALTSLVHWPTGAVLAGVLLGVTLVLVAVAAASAGERARHLRWATLVGTVLVCSALAWGVTLLVAVRSAPDTFRLPRAITEAKLRSHLPRLGLPVGIPAAALGLVGLARWRSEHRPGGDSGKRFLLTLLATWSALVAAVVAAWFLGWSVPVHRILLLALPVPMLGAVALLWLSAAAGRASPALRGGAILVGCLVVAGAGYVLWLRSPGPVLREQRIEAAASANAYLVRAVPAGETVTVLADLPSVPLDVLKQTFRVPLTASRIADVRFRRRSLSQPFPRRSSGSGVLLVVRGYSPSYGPLAAAGPQRVVAPGVVALRGPLPDVPVRVAAVPRLHVHRNGIVLALLGAGLLGLFGLVGAGWVRLVLRPFLRPVESVAVAPALGLAALVAAGLLADTAGVRIAGAAGPAIVALAGVAGALAQRAARRGRRSAEPEEAALP